MKRICMLSYSFYESDTRMLQYAAALRERGDDVDVISLRSKKASRFEVVDGVNVHRIQTREVNEQSRFAYLGRILVFLFVSTFFLARKQFSRKYQVIHVHSVPDFLVFAALVPKLLGARVILDIHDILPEFYASKFRAGSESLVFKLLVIVERVSTAFADHVIIANHLWEERLLSRSVKPGKCTTVLNYPPAAVFQRSFAPHKNGKFLITYPGSLNSHQGVDVAMRAFAKVADRMPNAEFHIYGEGPCKPSLLRLRDELGISRILIHDFRPTSEIAEIMAASDLAVVAKRASSTFGNEAVSTKTTEFMLLGVPLIMSRTKVDTFYHDDSMVKFFESENEAELADCMFLLWQDRDLCARLVANASRYVAQNNWREKRADYLRVIDSLVPQSSAIENRAKAHDAS
jgi:glycosyltransferase involved in cell wall biosynthesis